MEKPEISEKAKEQYLDASVTVFMEQYVELLHGDAELAEGDFPEELDVRCRKLIEQEKEKRSRKRMLHRVVGVCRRAAVFALVLLGLGTTLFLTVESSDCRS